MVNPNIQTSKASKNPNYQHHPKLQKHQPPKEPPKPSKNIQKASKSSKHIQKPSRSFKNIQKPSKKIQKPSKSYKNIPKSSKPSKNIQNLSFRCLVFAVAVARRLVRLCMKSVWVAPKWRWITGDQSLGFGNFPDVFFFVLRTFSLTILVVLQGFYSDFSVFLRTLGDFLVISRRPWSFLGWFFGWFLSWFFLFFAFLWVIFWVISSLTILGPFFGLFLFLL